MTMKHNNRSLMLGLVRGLLMAPSEGDGAAAGATEAKGKKKTDIETVTMMDGRVVEFAGKKQINKDYTVDPEGNINVRFDFRNTETRSLQFAGNDPIIYLLAGHGALQKLGDEMAASGDKYSLEDRISWFDDLADRLLDQAKTPEQRWAAERESGGGVSGISILVRALMEVKGYTAEEVKAKLNEQVEKMGVTKQALVQALRNSPALKPVVERLEAERAAKAPAVDVTAVLGSF